jgi:integrase
MWPQIWPQICHVPHKGIEADMKSRTGYLFYDESRKRWVGRVTFPDPTTGQRRYRKCYAPTKTEARIKLEKLRGKIEKQGTKVVANERTTFAQLADEFRSKKLIPAVFVNGNKVAGMKNHYTPGIYLDVLIEHFGPKRLDTIEHSDIEAFKLKRLQTPTKHNDQRSVASVHRELEVLRRVLNYAVTNRKLASNPFNAGTGGSLIQRKAETRRERIPTFGEEMALLETCVGKRAHLAHVIVIASDTGLRRNELLSLAWREDIDFEKHLINIRAINAKSNIPRSIPMTRRVHDRLKELYNQTGNDSSGLVFGGLRDVKRSFGTACETKEIADLHLHDLRHAFVTRTILAGIPPAIVLKASGHSSEEWKRYLNVTPDVLRGLLEPLPGQDSEAVGAYGLDVLKQLTEALGYIRRDGLASVTYPQLQIGATSVNIKS